jgi:hypothetical protein
MAKGEQETERLEPNEAPVKTIQGSSPNPVHAAKCCIELAGKQRIGDCPESPAMPGAEFELRMVLARRIEDSGARKSDANDVNENWTRAAMHPAHDPIVERDDLAGFSQELLTVIRKRDSPCRPDEQRQPQRPLKPLDVPAQRLLGHEETSCGTSKVEFLRTNHKGPDDAKVEVL